MTDVRTEAGGQRQSLDQPSYSGVEDLWAVERAMPGYNRWLVGRIASYLPAGARILEFGAGIGTLAMEWRAATGRSPECLEIDPSLREVLLARGLSVHPELIPGVGLFDGIYSSNVIEHIEDDVAALRQMLDHLQPGAQVVIYVPAFMCLYSGLDAAVGHHRRYTRKELTTKLTLAGFAVESCRYADFLGFFASLLVRYVGFKGKAQLGSEASYRTYDRYIFPLSRCLDALGARYCLGKNLLAVARRPKL